MGIDIRVPIGLMFSLLGLMLSGYGLMSDRDIYRRSLGYNVNLMWGAGILVFGLVMLYYGSRRRGRLLQ